MPTTYRLITATGIAALLVGVGILLHDGRTIALAVPFLVYTTFLLLYPAPPSLPGALTVTRRLSRHRITTGDTTTVTLTVVNHSSAITWLGISDVVPAGLDVERHGVTDFLGLLRVGETAKLTYTVRAPRGKYVFTDVNLRAWSRFGLPPAEGKATVPTHLRVLPRVERLEEIEIRPRRTRVYSGIVKANVGGTGTDFFGCRAYTPGDGIRRINWRAYAHTGKLVITEYEQERITDVNVILDVRAVANPDLSLFEHAVRATASLAALFLAQGNRVGLLIYGDVLNWTYPGFGKGQRERILDALASAAPADKAVFSDLRFIPARLFPSRSQLVVISPLAGEEDVEVFGLLRARGYQIILISPDPIDIWQAGLTGESAALATRILRLKRHVLLTSLARIGVEVVNWNPQEELAVVTAWALSRRGRRWR